MVGKYLLNLEEERMMKLELKKWSIEDSDDLVSICNAVSRTYLSNRLPFPYTEDHAKWWLGMVEENEGSNGIFRSISVDDKIVGNISVERKDDVFCKDAEIGYFLLTEYWSKGIMTEAVRQICQIAFDELDILRITGLVYNPNNASKKVLEKNGFAMEGTMKQAVVKDGSIYDLCILGKLR